MCYCYFFFSSFHEATLRAVEGFSDDDFLQRNGVDVKMEALTNLLDEVGDTAQIKINDEGVFVRETTASKGDWEDITDSEFVI